MQNLKTPVDKKGRKLDDLTKVQRFYSEFNSDSSSSSSPSSSDRDRNVFTFESKSFRRDNIAANPQKGIKTENGANNYSINVNTHNKYSMYESQDNDSIINHASPVLPMSPGLSSNQDLKDKALDLIYQKKIQELKSK